MIIVTSRVCAKQSKSVESFSRPVSAGTQASRPFMTGRAFFLPFRACAREMLSFVQLLILQGGKESPRAGARVRAYARNVPRTLCRQQA